MRVFWLVNIFLLLMSLSSCVPSGSDSVPTCSDNQKFDAVTRSCVAAGLVGDDIPVPTLDNIIIDEDSGYQNINLSYTDRNGINALTCSASSQNSGLIRRLELQGIRLISHPEITDAQNIVVEVNSSFAASVTTSTVGFTRFLTINVISGITDSATIANLINGDPVASTWVSASLSANQALIPSSTSQNVSQLECSCIGGVCSAALAPSDNFNGTTDLVYTITDSDGTSSLKPVTVTINSVNDDPTLSVVLGMNTTERAVSDTTSTLSGNLVTDGYVSISDANDGDVLGLFLTFEIVSAPTFGSLTLDSNGNFSYFTYAHETLDTFTFRVRDPMGGVSLTRTMNITVVTVDDAPIGTLTTIASFNEDQAPNSGVPITLTYTDEEGSLATSCSITSVTGVYPTAPCSCVAGICSAPFDSIGNFSGASSFSYRIFDAGGATPADRIVSFFILPVADDPIVLMTEASTGILQFSESTTHVPSPYNFTLDGAYEVDGEIITNFEVVSSPTNGTLSGCLGINGVSGLDCTYIPGDGNISDASTLSSLFPSADLSRVSTDSGTFYAKNFGDSYDGLQIELIDVTNMSVLFGSDAMTWIENGVIKFIIDAGVANGADIVSAIAASPIVSKLIQFDSNGALQNTMGTLALASGTATLSIVPPSDNLIYYNTSSGACYESVSGSWTVVDTHINDRTVNELDTIIIDKVKIDEGGGTIEDGESLSITNVDSSDETLIPLGNIEFYFDAAGDGISGADLIGTGTPFAAGFTADSRDFQIRITPQTIPSPSTALSSDIEITIQDSSGNTKEIEFTVNVQKIAVEHGGWRKIAGIGPKVNTVDIVEDPQVHCPYSLDMCNGGAECSGNSTPIGSVVPDNADAVYLVDSGTTNTCFRMKRVQVQNLAFIGKSTSTTTISYVDTGALFVSVLGNAITVNIDDDVTTTNQIKSAIELNASANALVKVINLKAFETQNTQSLTTLSSLSNNSWEEFSTFCPITPAAFETGCAEGARSDYLSCIGTTSPVGSLTPTKLDSRYFDEQSNMCYRSTGLTNTDWEAYDKTAAITLSWDQFSLDGSGSISEYKVFRRLANEDFDFSQQINREAIVGNSATYTFNDDAENSRFPPVPGTVYYYVVRPVVNNVLGATPAERSTGTPGVVRIMAPPKNMVFAHRWMMNKKMCDLINRTVDISQNYRCEYKGPGDSEVSGQYFYDMGKDLLVDRFEAGCPMSPAPNCPGTSDNSCVGLGEPGAAGKNISVAGAGVVYYDRSTAMCYISTGVGVSWTVFDTADIDVYFNTLDQSLLIV